MKVQSVYLISENSFLLQRLDKLFDTKNWKVNYIGGKKSNFRKHDSFIPIDTSFNGSFIEALLLKEELLESLNGLVILGSDGEMRQIADSDAKPWIKEKLLPFKNTLGYSILDSKIGLLNVTAQLGVKTPKQIVAHNMIQVSNLVSNSQNSLLIKGNSGGGGAFIVEIDSTSRFPNSKLDHISYPLVVQEKIYGHQIAVEAFYSDGELTGYIYNKDILDMSLFGPSYIRTSSQPESMDFIESLLLMGKGLGVHGMVNCTFILETETQKHYLVEFDARPNIWHHLASIHQINTNQLFEVSLGHGLAVPLAQIQVFSIDRFTQHALMASQAKVWCNLIRTITNGSSYSIEVASQEPKRKIGYAIRKFSRFFLLVLLVKGFRTLPIRWQAVFKRRGITLRMSTRIMGQ